MLSSVVESYGFGLDDYRPAARPQPMDQEPAAAAPLTLMSSRSDIEAPVSLQPKPIGNSTPLVTLPATSTAPVTSDQAARRRAGWLLLGVTVSAAIGGAAGGPWGAGAGAIFAGAAANLWRAGSRWASPDAAQRAEAGKGATVGLIGLGLGSILAYQAYRSRKE